MQPTNVNPTATSTAERQLANRLILDFIIILISLIPIAIFEFAIEPPKRGFFCDDESLKYPFRDNTVTPVMLGLLVGLLPTLIFGGIEFVRYQQKKQLDDSVVLFGFKLPKWFIEFQCEFFNFCFGVSLTFNATEVGKYTIGRLRPHFMAVCQPQLLDSTTCSDPQNQQRYVENYFCMGSGYSIDDVRQARISFPSGHASLSFYAMIYCAFYVHNKVTWRGSKLTRYFMEFVLVMLAWFTALSRVMDHWHHWSDVLIGSIIGFIGAWFSVFIISSTLKSTNKLNSRPSLPRQDTTTTLQDIITVPPPYTINSFGSGEYCTKV